MAHAQMGTVYSVESVAENALDVDTAGRAVYVDTTTYTAMYVDHAGYDAYSVCHTGSAVGCTHSDNNNGLEVANAQSDGVVAALTVTWASQPPTTGNNNVLGVGLAFSYYQWDVTSLGESVWLY